MNETIRNALETGNTVMGGVTGGKPRQEHLVPLMLSINCVASGLGWTG